MSNRSSQSGGVVGQLSRDFDRLSWTSRGVLALMFFSAVFFAVRFHQEAVYSRTRLARSEEELKLVKKQLARLQTDLMRSSRGGRGASAAAKKPSADPGPFPTADEVKVFGPDVSQQATAVFRKTFSDQDGGRFAIKVLSFGEKESQRLIAGDLALMLRKAGFTVSVAALPSGVDRSVSVRITHGSAAESVARGILSGSKSILDALRSMHLDPSLAPAEIHIALVGSPRFLPSGKVKVE